MAKPKPVGMGLRDSLLVKEKAIHSVRVALHLHRASGYLMEHVRGDVEVIANEVSLRQSALREEDLVRVRDRDLAATDSHVVISLNYWCSAQRSPEFVGNAPRHFLIDEVRGPIRTARPRTAELLEQSADLLLNECVVVSGDEFTRDDEKVPRR